LITIIKYEHDRLSIGEEGFKKSQWDSFVKLNQLNEGKYFTVEHKGLRFSQYVGVIQVDGFTVEIHPKADKNDDDANWRGVLIQMLKACGKVKVNTYADAHLNQQNLNLLEIYFDQYLLEVETLLRTGLVKKYNREEGNVKALKGKLDFAKNIRHNLVHKERFYTVHQVYNVDHKLHQILAQALQIVSQFSSAMWIADRCKRVQLHFPEVKTITADKQLLDSIQLNRKTEGYERALELARLIILNYSPNIASGNEKMISILFDMNQLWEEYMLKMLKKSAPANFEVLGKRRLPFWGSNRLEPDIVLKKRIENDATETFIIDTKWKTPGKQTSIQDLRQLYAYARFWKSTKVMLLYPGRSQESEVNEFEDELFEGRVTCYKTFVSVLKDENVLDDGVGDFVVNLIH
tara:strand:+ start:5474 stop:6688 length:1215 start_codon:yes stop_codon:yes gene_type:complete